MNKVISVTKEEWLYLIELKRSVAWMKDFNSRTDTRKFSKAIDWETEKYKEAIKIIVH